MITYNVISNQTLQDYNQQTSSKMSCGQNSFSNSTMKSSSGSSISIQLTNYLQPVQCGFGSPDMFEFVIIAGI